MQHGAITGYMDVAQVVLYAFWIFFAGLIFYLRREDRREGYPLESEAAGGLKDPGFLLIPTPKFFHLHDGTVAQAPRASEVLRELNVAKVEPWPGAPLAPTGDAMRDAVGPGGYALRADTPDLTFEGHPRIVPMRDGVDFVIAAESPDPRGAPVVGADGRVAGTVSDIWIDRGESLVRYYEVALEGAARRVLLPVAFSKVDTVRRILTTEAILAEQFAFVPETKSPDMITLLEEEQITAYYGAGTLYATPDRAEALL